MKIIKIVQLGLLVILLAWCQLLSAQSPDFSTAFAEVSKDVKPHNSASTTSDIDYHGPTDRLAYFPGGKESLFQFIQNTIRYPQLAQHNAVEGMVLVGFELDQKGNLKSPYIIQSPGFDLDKEALRIMQQMPRWKPALRSGQPVASKMKLAINFKLR